MLPPGDPAERGEAWAAGRPVPEDQLQDAPGRGQEPRDTRPLLPLGPGNQRSK